MLSFFNLQESTSAQAKSDENQPPSFPSSIPVHQFLLRTLLVRFENLNKALFESRFIPSANATSFRDHLKHQLWPGVWGTQVELMATATLFQVPVYCCYTNLSGANYHWEAIKPIATPANLRVPEIVEEACTPHITLNSYTGNTHTSTALFHNWITHSAHLFLFCLVLNTSWI